MLELSKSQRAVAKAVSKCKGSVLHYVHVKKGFIEAGDAYIYVQKKVDYSGKELLLEVNSAKESDDFHEVVGQSPYPSFEHFFNKDKPIFNIAMDRELLKKLLSALGNGDNPVRFYFYGKEKPIRVEIPEENTRSIIMPLLTKWEG